MNKDLKKQIEEAAIVYENQRKQDLSIVSEGHGSFFFSFLDGAKSEAAKEYWQQGMYSEEEVKILCSKAWLIKGDINDLIYQFDNWFDRNKKK